MNKIVKFTVIGLALVAFIIIALAVLAKVVITPERVREAVTKATTELLNRQVTIGDIEVSVTSGIVINGLIIKERQGEDPFVAADRVELRYQLAPLLAKRLVIDEVRLDKPQLRVARLSDGSFNFSDLLPGKGKGQPGGSGAGGRGHGDADINLLIAKLLVQEATLTVIDQAVQPGKTFQQQLTLDLAVSDISLSQPFPVSIKGVVAGAPFTMQAEVKADGTVPTASFTVDGLELATFAPYFQKSLPGKLTALKLSTDIAVSAAGAGYQVKGTISARDVDLVLDAQPKAPITGLSMDLDHDLLVEPGTGLLTINQATLRIGKELALGLGGRVTDFKSKPNLDLTVQLKEQDVAAALAALPSKLVEPAKAYAPTGTLSLRLRLAGPPGAGGKLLKEGEIHLAGIQAAAGGMKPEVNGTIVIAGNKLTSKDLTLTLADNSASLALSVEELGQTPYRVNMALASDRFQLDPFLAPGAKGGDKSATGQPGTPAAKPAEEVGPISLPVQATGQIRIAKALYHDLAIDTFDLEFTLDKNILTVSRMTGATGGGTFSNTARVDLGQKGFAYATTIGVKGVKAAEILPPFFPKTKGAVSGTMDLTADLTGAGTRPATAKRALLGKGELLLVDGELTGTGMAEGLASFLGLQELRVLRFSRFLTRFAIAAGVARIDSEASGSDIRLSPAGTVGLVDEAVDLTLNAKLSPALSAKLDRQGQFSKLLGTEEGWTPLPLKVTGTVGTPRFTLDSAQLMKKATGELQKRMFDQLRPKQKAPATDGQPPAQQSPAQGMENTIRGLFGR